MEAQCGLFKMPSLKTPALGHLHDPGFEPIQCFRYDDLADMYSPIRKEINRNCMQKEKRSKEKLKTTNDNKRKEKKGKEEKKNQERKKEKNKDKKRN